MLGEERALMVEQVAPLIDRQLEDARRLLGLGEGGGLVLLESLVRAHDTKMRLIDVWHDEARAHATISYLAGPATRIESTDDKSAEPADEATP